MELSGCDAVFVLDHADLARAVDAIAFGLRINGSATCMAPRRIFVSASMADAFAPMLVEALASMPPVHVPGGTRDLLQDLVDEATLYGGTILLNGLGEESGVSATVIANATPDMRVTQTDIFAPVLSLLTFHSIDEALAAHALCPYALTAAIFGPAREADALAARLRTGTVLVNDLIVSTADPRASFGGRGQSGFGSTRGREGLLEMTAVKTVLHQKSRSRVPYQPTTNAHGELFAAYIRAVHSGSRRQRWQGLKALVRAASKFGR
jgi:aldehyde dehydrogenase (NAD+)